MSDRGSVYRPDDGTSKVLTVGVIATGVQQRSSVENCTFNAEIGADIYDMTIADDPATEKPSRSQLLVSSTGSLSQRVGTRLPATSVVVRSFQGDVRVEGSVSAQDQSYLLQSRRRDQLEGPYQFSTTSQRSGSKNGLISGGVVSITLGNDLDTPDLPDRVAYNDVTLNTDIRSLRIRAATRQGNPLAYPFPYEASISEANSLDVDAVAASSFPLSFQTAGSLRFNAVLETAGDVNLRTFGELSVAAPISTSLGVLSLEAESNVKVGSSLQVTKAIEDKARDDIFIRANAGNIQLDNGLIKAVNGVRLVQANTVSRYASTASTPLTVGTVAAPTVTTSSITINETVAASDINVKMSVTHPAVGALRATLIAPNKTRYRLLSNVGGGDKNFAGTIFDTEAPLSITEGSAPFSGSYRPIDSLASLNGQSLRGVWTLEVTNTGAAGAIDLFELNASTSKSTDAPGTISGTGLVSADRLSLVASGSVGDPAALPQAGNYSLRTQVNTVTGRAGGSVALWEKDALEVNSLRAPGPVTIRTDGYDQFIESAWQPTLRGDLIDATKVTLSAPNGSINMRVNTPDTIYFGNIGTISIPVSAQLASQYGMQAAGSVTFRSSGGATKGDVVVLDAPDAGGNARKVRSLIQVDADKAWSAKEWTYSKGVAGKVASTITGTKLGSLLPKAKVGDRVLVKQARKEKPADELSHDYAGVYSVTSIANGEIKLTRASDSDTKDEMQSGTIVAHADPDSGVVYYRFRIADLAQDFGAPPIRVTPEIISSNIGSDDPTDQTRFVVSTSDGTNSRAGSFGKMLALIQANLPASGSLADVDELLPILQFSSSIVGSIQLDQELPFITKPLAINGNNRYPIPGTTAVNTGIVIDGYDILFDRNGNAVTSASVINGLSYQLPEQATEVSSLTNLSIGGFQQGAAIKVDSDAKSGVLSIDKVNVGLDANSNRLSNKVGVLITGTSSGVSLTNSNLASSTAAAIHIAGAAANTKLTGNMIGFSTLDNVYGIAVTSTGTNSIGLAGGGRNTIQYSQTGIGLFSGTTTVVNNDIARNIFDGIRIMGGKNTIGFESKSKALTTDSNSIYGNSRFGINVITKAFVDRTKQGIDPIFGRYVGVQLPQTISLNYLGVANFGKLLSVNTRGNIAVDGVRVTPATGRAYIPTSAAGRDLSNNQHGKTTVPVVKTPRTPAVPSKPATPVTSVNPVTPSKAVAIPPAKATTKFPWRKR
jgi:subtilisin-like proprotein convertase family protein